VTLGWPLAACAQQADQVYWIGYLSLGSPAAEATLFNAFRAGLAALGYVDGKRAEPRRPLLFLELRAAMK
jgi:hypothetical protein